MSEPKLTLAQRRMQLLAESAFQRDALATQLSHIMHPLGHIDTGISVIRRIRHKPAILAGIAAAVIAIRPRRIKAMFQHSSKAWSLWSRVSPTVQHLLAQRFNL